MTKHRPNATHYGLTCIGDDTWYCPACGHTYATLTPEAIEPCTGTLADPDRRRALLRDWTDARSAWGSSDPSTLHRRATLTTA